MSLVERCAAGGQPDFRGQYGEVQRLEDLKESVLLNRVPPFGAFAALLELL